MKYTESLQRTGSQPGIEQSFLFGQQLEPYSQARYSEIHAPASMQKFENLLNISKPVQILTFL